MYKSILLTVDLANASEPDKAFHTAVSLARAHGAEIHAVNVLPDFGMSIVSTYFEDDFEKKVLTDCAQRLKAFVDEHAPDDVTMHPHVLHGTIYDEIIKAADENGCDVIVMASHRPELKDYLLGPNSARVMRHANQSVFIVRD